MKKMQFDVVSFRMDDTSFYKTIVDYIKNTPADHITRDGKINNNYIMDVVQCTILNYLGLHSSEARRNALYDSKIDLNDALLDDTTLSIGDFKQKNAAMCVEKSAMAQNILAFLGYNPMMIFGYLSSEKGAINEGHSYNCIIRNGKAILADFTNPIMKDGKYYKPALFPVDYNTLEDFKKGKAQIEVTHKDLRTCGDYIEEIPTKLVYSSEEINEKYFDKPKNTFKKVQEQNQEEKER